MALHAAAVQAINGAALPAHELGHNLGLSHYCGGSNDLMRSSITRATYLGESQATTILRSTLVRCDSRTIFITPITVVAAVPAPETWAIMVVSLMGVADWTLHRLSSRLRLAAFAPVVLAACAVAATPPDWRERDLGGFALHTPADMQLHAGGKDSQAGTLRSGSLRIDYDFGLYSDPLTPRVNTLEYQAGAAMVDGLPARQVRFRMQDAAGPSRPCIGVHVPQVRQTGIGPLRLTVLACADKPEQLKDVPAIFASIRFTDSGSR